MGGGHQHGAAGALYLHGHSWVHRLPAHVKIIALLAFVLIVVGTPATWRWTFLVYAGLLAVVAVVAGVPFATIARRMTVEIPFLFFALLMPFFSAGPTVEVLGMTLSEPGLVAAFAILVKATLGVIASILLAATTTAHDLILGLQRLRMPELIVQIASFMIRYAEVITSEMHRMSVARASRCFDARGPRQWRVLGQSAGALFIRSYERGERVHLAMLSRGFTGRMPFAQDSAALPSQWLGALALPATAAVVLLISWTLTR
jgi:cobalt/nickel transport system permease protein